MITQGKTGSKPVVVRIRDAAFSYGDLPVLTDVNLEISAGELAYIVGPNGGGKTTLLKLILGLQKPDRGVIEIFSEAPEKSFHRIGYSPQYIHFDPQFPITVLDIVLMGSLIDRKYGFFSRQERAAAFEALDRLDIKELAEDRFSQLSGGQRQRVLIARSLVNKPELLLLDEPTANVDFHTEDRLMTIIKELRENHTVLLVSHDFNFVSEEVNKVVCVNREVHVHPTSDVTGEALQTFYEKNMRLVRHDLDYHNHSKRR